MNGAINVTDVPFSAPTGGKSNSGPDARAAIQAAIDYAIANRVGTVIIPGGDFRLSAPLFMDDPRNLRVSKTAPPFTSSFQLKLLGPGATLWTDFNNDIGLWVGPGRKMVVDGLSVSGPPAGPAGFRLGLPSTGVGIGLASDGSGTLIENCSVNLFYTGIQTSANGVDRLCDATTIRNCSITAAIGVDFFKNNNLINSVENCVIDAIICIFSTAWGGAHVHGGNCSSPSTSGNSFPISAVSIATLPGIPKQTAYEITLTATIAAPDALFLAGAYNAFAIPTQHYGIVPFKLTSWNVGTGVATFVVLDGYSGVYFAGSGNDPATHTNLISELQAAPRVYAAEIVTSFMGMGIYANGVHIENGATPTTLVDSYFGTAGEGGAHNVLRDIRINGNLTNEGLGVKVVAGTATEKQKAQYYVSRSWPQIKVGYTETTIEAFMMDKGVERLIVDFFNPNAKFTWRGAGPKLQLRTPITAYPFGTAPWSSAGDDIVYQVGAIPAFGTGEFESNPFYSAPLNDADGWRSPWGKGRAPMQGLRPVPWCSPVVTPAQVAVLTGALPPIVLSPLGGPVNIKYPLLWGGQIYRLQEWYVGAQPNYQLISNHHFYSYGQSLPIAWNHIGQSPFLYVSDTRMLFPGLGIKIDHGDGSVLYLVTGVYPQMGMVSVLKAVESARGPWLLHGDKATVYTGSSIGQEAYDITRF